jgi:predicted  nucleic acid-binding Zn-ribbon protein
MTGLEQLLTLQAHDLRIDQLRHKLAHLPERAAVTSWEQRREAHASALAAAHLEREQLGREAKRYEDEAAIIEAKADDADAKLYSGSVTNPKELQALQDDVASLRRRQDELEELELGFMVQCEPVDATLAELAVAGDELEAEGQRLTVALAEAESELAAELATVEADRAECVHHVAGDLLTEYDRLRPVMGGVAAAKLRGSVCEGCHLSLSAVALDKIRHAAPEAVLHCDECGRILVRVSV